MVNKVSYTKREPANEADARTQGKSMVTQSSSNHVPIEVRNTKTITDTKLTNKASISCLKTTLSHQDLTIHQPVQTEDHKPDDTKTKRSMFESSQDNKSKHSKEENINLLLATNSSIRHLATRYTPSIALLGGDMKLPSNLLVPYLKPKKPPNYFVTAIRDNNTMMGERHNEEEDPLLLIRRGSKFDPGPFTTTEGLGPAVYRIRSQTNRVAHDHLGLTVEGTPKRVKSN